MVRFDKSTSQRGQSHIEDRRGRGGGRGISFGRGSSIGRRGSVGVGGIIVLILSALLGNNLLGDGGNSFSLDSGFPPNAGSLTEQGGVIDAAPSDSDREYMAALMADIQDTWAEYFDQAGLSYTYTKLVLYDDFVSSEGCGQASSAVGPFYCPAPGDHKVYVDLGFFAQLATEFGAPGDFAQAYVIAHEVGHHLQAITGISDQVRQLQVEDPGNKNDYAILQELQADCFAGVWAYSANRRRNQDGTSIIEPGDIEEGIAAAGAVGDDRIQSQAGININPETWTHGSSEQRVEWFMRGFDSGDPEQCNTFNT